jgi:hypothetical protein
MSRKSWPQNARGCVYYGLKSSIFVEVDDLFLSGRTSINKSIIDVLFSEMVNSFIIHLRANRFMNGDKMKITN